MNIQEILNQNLNGIAEGRDAVASPYPWDMVQYGSMLVKTFFRQPIIGRKLAQHVEPVAFDGKKIFEMPRYNDIDEPTYAMEPELANVSLEGDTITAKLPQIVEHIEIDEDKINLLFAGRDRLPLSLSLMMQKIAEKEDKIIFQGDSNLGVEGLCNTTYATEMNPTGHWGIDSTSDGRLENVETDIANMLSDFADDGFGGVPIDLVFTQNVYNLLKTTLPTQYAGKSELQLIKELTGGEIYVTNHLIDSASYATTNNAMLALARAQPELPGWMILSSEFNHDLFRQQHWKMSYAIREKFSVKIVEKKMVRAMLGIDTATS